MRAPVPRSTWAPARRGWSTTCSTGASRRSPRSTFPPKGLRCRGRGSGRGRRRSTGWSAMSTAWTPPRRYGLWHDRAVFHFLTDPADRAAYARVLDAATAPGAIAIIASFAEDGPETMLRAAGAALRPGTSSPPRSRRICRAFSRRSKAVAIAMQRPAAPSSDSSFRCFGRSGDACFRRPRPAPGASAPADPVAGGAHGRAGGAGGEPASDPGLPRRGHRRSRT